VSRGPAGHRLPIRIIRDYGICGRAASQIPCRLGAGGTHADAGVRQFGADAVSAHVDAGIAGRVGRNVGDDLSRSN